MNILLFILQFGLI